MANPRTNTTGYQHPQETNLLNVHKALEYNANGQPVLRVSIGNENVEISGNVFIPGNIAVFSTPENPVHSHITEIGTSGILTVPWMPVAGNVRLDAGTNSIGNVRITDMPGMTGTVNIGTMPEVEIKNDAGNAIPVTGNLTATVADVITVIVDEDAGENFSFNNHATNTNRGWTMDNTMRPVVSFRVTDTGTTINDIIEIIEYEIGNNNANQSTIIYEWYEGPLTISGAAIPAWTNLGTKIQYRVYQDQYSSNTGNTFTVPAGTHMRHSGIIIGKNAADDEGPCALYGGATPNMLTLCMKRVDNATKLDVWFAFTIKELA